MVTVKNEIGVNAGTGEFEFAGLSTDTKPTLLFNGKQVGVNSLFLELDTGDVYYFTGSDWAKIGG